MTRQRIILNVAFLPGNLEAKLKQAAALEFSAIEIGNTDLTSTDQTLQSNACLLRASELKVAAFHELRDFLGHPSHLMEYKMNLAKSNLRLMAEINADLLLVTPALKNNSKTGLEAMVEPLKALAMLGTVRGVRIGLKPLPSSKSLSNYAQVISLLNKTDHANLCLVIDNISLQNSSAASVVKMLQAVPIELIGLVQLSAVEGGSGELTENISTRLPTAGSFAPYVERIITILEKRGYAGFYSLNADVFSYPTFSGTMIHSAVIDSLHYLQKLIGQTDSQ